MKKAHFAWKGRPGRTGPLDRLPQPRGLARAEDEAGPVPGRIPASRRVAPCRRRGRLGWALALAAVFALSCPPEVLARAGGGRAHGGGILLLILLPILLIYAWYVNRRINQKKALTEQAMTRMAAKDRAWDELALEAFVREDFFRIERAWCEQDYAALRARLTETLFAEWKAQLDLMASQGRKDVLENLSLEQVRFVEAKDYPGKNRDEFTVCLDASATDYTIDAAGTIVASNAPNARARARKQKQQAPFREFWTYHRKEQGWALAAIAQSGQWGESVDAPIVEEG